MRLTIDFAAVLHNVATIDAMVRSHGATWTLATNVLSGDEAALGALDRCGIRSFADTRIGHMRTIREVSPEAEAWLMRLPSLGTAPQVVELADISLNSEMTTLAALDAAAERQGTRHAVILMVEIGDLSEGIFSGDLVDFYAEARRFRHIDVLGLGGNLGFRSGVAPNVEQLNQLALFRELLELKFGSSLPFVSAGTSAVLPLLATAGVPEAINHFRVGESVFLGSDLVNGGVMSGLRGDAVTLEAEVVEVKLKTLYYRQSGSSLNPFEAFTTRTYAPGERGYRAVVRVGQVDTETAGLMPVEPPQVVLGAGSDLIVVDLGPDHRGIRVGDTIRFRPSYRALMRLMAGSYVDKRYVGLEPASEESHIVLPPAMSGRRDA